MKKHLPIFSAYGVELEYMIVNCDDLTICPISDRLIHEVTGTYHDEVTFEHIAWSNELVLHVIELKTNGPSPTLEFLPNHFQDQVQKINKILAKYNAKLLPTGAHPLMNPYSEARLWPHDYNIVYEAYHRIFDCRGHGWSNLQSVHLNLPFANDEEFAKLHTAIRLILPIIPALTASTPIIDGKLTGLLDTRLEYYRSNQQKIPSVTGYIIPELVFSEQEYREKILQKIYTDIAIHDPEKILQEEWLNSRGAIARFDRNTIEIRIIDTQESPQADLAILNIIVATLKAIVNEKWQDFSQQVLLSEQRLQKILLDAIKFGMNTKIEDKMYLEIFGIKKHSITMADLWEIIAKQVLNFSEDQNAIRVLDIILDQGNLAERIIAALQKNFTKEKITQVYQNLASCLQEGEIFNSDENNNHV